MDTFHLKTGDTLPAYRVAIEDGGQPVALPADATGVKFVMRLDRKDAVALVGGMSVLTPDPLVVEYLWEVGDTDAAGRYLVEVRVEALSGDQTFPRDGHFVVIIGASLDD